MEKMLFSGVQSNSEVALIAIKGIKNQPGIAAKVFGAIAEEKINVELILQSIGCGENKDISFVVAQDEADHAVETLKKAFDEAFDKAMASLGEERDAAWEEANKALMDDMPITALYYPSFVALVNEDQVENVELTLGNSFMFSHAEIVE